MADVLTRDVVMGIIVGMSDGMCVVGEHVGVLEGFNVGTFVGVRVVGIIVG